MFDMSKISDEQLFRLAGAYMHATFIYGGDPLEASEKKQRKIRKWICRQYTELVRELPEEAGLFSAEDSDRDVLAHLKECCDLQAAKVKDKEDKFESDFAVLGEPVKSALRQLLQIDFWPKLRFLGSDVQIVTDSTPAFRRILTLKNADAVPMGKIGCFCYNLELVLLEDRNRFCFRGELEDPEGGAEETFTLTFENAEVEIQLYNACEFDTFIETPWEGLSSICYAICLKSDLPGDYCNPMEKEILTLIREVADLAYWRALPQQSMFSFGELKELTRKFGYNKVENMLGKMEATEPGDRELKKIANKLTAILCEKRHEPLWREIYNKIAESQAEYPHKADSLCDKELLTSVRGDIQELMESKGYLGTYPDFVKAGALKGIHLCNSYNMSYLIGMENRAQYHVHCYESFEEDNNLTITFLCGAAFLKKDEEETDIYDCIFNAKGRRLFHTVHNYIPLQAGEVTEADNLETSVSIAVKKAECLKLTKEEQKEYYGNTIPGWRLFFWIFLIGGGMFGIAMTLIGMLLCVMAMIVFGEFSEIPGLFTEIPWGLCLAICWVFYGVSMGIIEVLALRK